MNEFFPEHFLQPVSFKQGIIYRFLKLELRQIRKIIIIQFHFLRNSILVKIAVKSNKAFKVLDISEYCFGYTLCSFNKTTLFCKTGHYFQDLSLVPFVQAVKIYLHGTGKHIVDTCVFKCPRTSGQLCEIGYPVHGFLPVRPIEPGMFRYLTMTFIKRNNFI